MKEQIREKNAFFNIYIVAALLLLTFPFVVTFSEFLSRIFEKLYLYRLIQDFIVPYETRLVWGVLNAIGLKVAVTPTGIITQNASVYLSWNCLGWQSLILLVLTLFTGLSGRFSTASRVETILIGVFGTFIINVLRIVVVVLFAVNFGRTGAYLFHNYLATVVAIFWIVFFWWFAYKFVLEEKQKG